MPSQFGSLIVEPIQELEKQGKRVQAKAVFIDGLDECAGRDEQAEIIKIIASSVRERSTPFYWVIFSRAEPRIILTFNQDSIASVTHSVELPISREADGEIEMYLRGGFKNILEQQDFPELSSSWPTDNDIWILVKAAAGLFAHPAAVLRHVAYPADSQFRERLQFVLDSLSDAGKQGIYITIFATRCSLCPHHGADSRAQSPVCTTPVCTTPRISGQCHVILLHE